MHMALVLVSQTSSIFHSLFLKTAKLLKLKVHPWTQQDDMLKHTSNPVEETMTYLNMGVDGMFVEFPHLTKSIYDKHLKQQEVVDQFFLQK